MLKCKHCQRQFASKESFRGHYQGEHSSGTRIRDNDDLSMFALGVAAGTLFSDYSSHHSDYSSPSDSFSGGGGDFGGGGSSGGYDSGSSSGGDSGGGGSSE